MLRTRHQTTTKFLFANAKVPMGCQKSSDASSDANSDVGSDSGFDAGVAAASLRVSAEAADLRRTPASKFHGRVDERCDQSVLAVPTNCGQPTVLVGPRGGPRAKDIQLEGMGQDSCGGIV